VLDIAKSKQKYIGAVAPNSPFTVDEIAPMPRIEMICLDELEVPPMQRDLVEGRLDSTIAKFDGWDWNLHGIIVVWYNPATEKYYNIDGRHRVDGIRRFQPNIEYVPAIIIETTDIEYISRIFAGFNGVASKKLNAEELLLANVYAKDATALYHESVLLKADIASGKVPVNNHKGKLQVKYPNFVKALKHGEANLLRAIELCKAAYPGQKIDDVLMAGLAFMFETYADSGLSDNNTKFGAMFEQWFIDNALAMDGKTPAYQFKNLKDCNTWHIGRAYGIYANFRRYATAQNMTAIPGTKIIQELYNANGGENRA
jgi:hypothetical protein